MKLIVNFLLCMLLLYPTQLPVGAATNSSNNFINSELYISDNISITDEIVIHPQFRSSERSFDKSRTYKHENATIAIITVSGTFRYDGKTVSVISKSVTRVDTYNGWTFSKNSLSSQGGSIALSGRLSKSLNPSIPVSISLTCDHNGNIS